MDNVELDKLLKSKIGPIVDELMHRYTNYTNEMIKETSASELTGVELHTYVLNVLVSLNINILGSFAEVSKLSYADIEEDIAVVSADSLEQIKGILHPSAVSSKVH